MIVDCFTFYNELDVLELRLEMLGDAVDRFVLCEAPFTFRGTPKPLWYADHAARFARWSDRIVHAVYSGPANENPWMNEWGQRAYLTQALGAGDPDDIVMIGDVDEFPDPRNVGLLAESGRILGHRQRHAVGYVNRVVDQSWIGTRSLARRDIATFGTLNDVRLRPQSELTLVDGGWHLSALGGAAAMKRKFHAYAHAEVDVPYYTDRRALEAELGAELHAQWIPLDDAFPAVLRQPRWAGWVWERPALPPDAAPWRVVHAHGCYAYVDPDAAAIAAVTDDAAAWAGAGRERFGGRFTIAAPSVAAAVAGLPPGSWLVVDAFERLTDAELHALRERRLTVVAFARNARSYLALERVMRGEPFPPGRALGVPEIRARIDNAGFALLRFDEVTSRAIFAPVHLFPAAGTFEARLGPFHLLATSREDLAHFVAHAFVATFASRPAAGDRA